MINAYTYRVMGEIGYDLARHSSKGVEVYLAKTLFQYVITVCDDADQNCPTVWMSVPHRRHWSFEDPAKFRGTDEETLAKFREVRDKTEERILAWVRAGVPG